MLDLFTQLSQERDNNTEDLILSSSFSSTQNPCDVSSGSVICYYYNRFIDRCIPTYTTSRCHTYARIITNNKVIAPVNQIQKQNGEIFDVIQGNLSDVPYESNISMYGRYTESTHILIYKNATVR